MASPFEHAWMLLKNEGEMPMQNNYPQDPPGMRPPPVEFPPGMESTPVPPSIQVPNPKGLVSNTGRLSDLSDEEINEGMMKVPPLPPKPPGTPVERGLNMYHPSRNARPEENARLLALLRNQQ